MRYTQIAAAGGAPETASETGEHLLFCVCGRFQSPRTTSERMPETVDVWQKITPNTIQEAPHTHSQGWNGLRCTSTVSVRFPTPDTGPYPTSSPTLPLALPRLPSPWPGPLSHPAPSPPSSTPCLRTSRIWWARSDPIPFTPRPHPTSTAPRPLLLPQPPGLTLPLLPLDCQRHLRPEHQRGRRRLHRQQHPVQ